MEEADLDELEWMACQQFPPEEDEDFYDGYDNMPPPPDIPPGTLVSRNILEKPKCLHLKFLLRFSVNDAAFCN